MPGKEIRLIGGLLVAAVLTLAMVSATAAQTSTSIDSLDAAAGAFAGYLERTGNPDLVLDEVMQFERNYYASVKDTSSDTGAFELLADPRTGRVFPEMGPNVMWNTRYSPMASYGRGIPGG